MNLLISSSIGANIHYSDDRHSLLIRSLEDEDAITLDVAVKNSKQSLITFMDWAHYDSSSESQLARIKSSRQNFQLGTEYDFVVFDTSTNDFLMSASWHGPKTRNQNSLEIGYWTTIEHTNKGLATLVTKILTVVAFEYMGCDRVEIGCNKENHGSHRVIEKCGFKFEGEVRNYFSRATEKMLENGYCPERNYLQYSFTSEDLLDIDWYSVIKKSISVDSFFKKESGE